MSDIPTDPQEEAPTPPTPSPADDAAPYVTRPPQPEDNTGAPPADVVTTADAVTRPAVTAAAPTAPGIPDETHNSIDPQTGALTAEALDRRAEIVRLVQEAGHTVASFEEAIKHWVEMQGS